MSTNKVHFPTKTGGSLQESEAKRPRFTLNESRMKLGNIMGNLIFLELFHRLYFPSMTVEECAQHIWDTVGENNINNVVSGMIISIIGINSTMSDSFLIILEMLLHTYNMYNIQQRLSNSITCFMNDTKCVFNICGSMIENGMRVFLSELFQIKLVKTGNTIRYEATFRVNIQIGKLSTGESCFILSDDMTHPPTMIGRGTFGYVFKIMSINGKYSIVKVFNNYEHAIIEWKALKLVYRKHPCLQIGEKYQSRQNSDVKCIIVSMDQGDIPLSRFRVHLHKFTMQDIFPSLSELSKALEIVHEQGIVHCDIKPNNIIIRRDSDGTFHLVLIDFGIAKEYGIPIEFPNSQYTWLYRNPILFLSEYVYEKLGTPWCKFYNYNVRLSPVMDWWAFFVTCLQTFSHPSNIFLGFRTQTEEDARVSMYHTSPVVGLMMEMGDFIAGMESKPIINITFIRDVYFMLLNKEGPEKLTETFNKLELKDEPKDGRKNKINCADLYKKLEIKIHNLRTEHPMIVHVQNVFAHMSCEDKSVDISRINHMLNELFVEILRDGADLSLLECLTMDHVRNWLKKLDDIIGEMSKMPKIYFY